MITDNLSTLKINVLSQPQYDRELAAGNIDASAMYLTPDEEIVIDTYMSDVSENPVQNKVIKAYIDSLIGNILNGAS